MICVGTSITKQMGGGPPLWTPAQLGSLLYWFDFSDQSTVVYNGANIAQITCKKSGVVCSQAVAALQPAWSFSPNFANKAICTIAINSLRRLQSTVSVPHQPSGHAFAMIRFAGTNGLPHYHWTKLLTNLNWRLERPQSPNSCRGSVQDAGGTKTATTGTTLAAGTPTLDQMKWDGSTVKARTVNETEGSTATGALNVDVGGLLSIGYDVASSRGMGGDIPEIIQFTAPLADADRDRVEGYAYWKYGRQASLPALHPYKNAAPTV